MRTVLLAALALHAAACAADGARQVLFDFESGVQSWWGNPWGGGECSVAPADSAKYGRGALTCSYRDVQKGANAVSPDLPADAAWRARPWGGFSLWLKGDGSPASVHIAIETFQDRSAELKGGATFSVDVPLEDTAWHRLEFAFARLWNREHLALDPARIRRFILGATGTRQFQIDQLALEPPGRKCWLDADAQVAGGPVNGQLTPPVWTALADGRLELRLDLEPLREAGDLPVGASVTAGEQTLREEFRLGPESTASGELAHAFLLRTPQDTMARAAVRVQSPAGEVLAAWGCTFALYGPEPEPPPSPLAIYPVPKHSERHAGVFRFGEVTRVRAEGLAADDLRRSVGLLVREMAEYHGKRLERVDEGEAQIVCRVAPGTAPGGSERYELTVAPERITLTAPGPQGLYHAVQSLLAAVDAETRLPREAVAPCCKVLDWPSFPFRGVSVSNPTNRWGYPNDPSYPVEDFCEFVYRTVARQKLNTVVLIVPEGMRFESHPELAAPHAWSRDELRRFVAFARDHYLDVIPLVTVLGHANWFTVTHKELVEPANDHNIACVRLPETNRLIADVLEEVVEVFQPVTVHLGMDECWWRTLDKPEAERCPRCGRDWPAIVAEQATFFHDLLKRKGIRSMIWGDMLLPEHNGGAPYHTARALPSIPRGMTIANWSASLAPDSSKRFRDAGLGVVRANSFGVPRAEASYVGGNLMGLWSKTPWLTDTYYTTAPVYSFLSLPQAAEFSWNVDPRLDGRALSRELLDERADSVMRRIALRPSPRVGAETTPIGLGALATAAPEGLAALPDGTVEVARVRFVLGDRVLAPAPDRPATVPVNAHAAEVDLLVACGLPTDKYESFVLRFRQQDSVRGVLIGAVEFSLADGSTETLELRYAHNVLPWDRTLAASYLYGALGSLSTTGDAPRASAYAVQWVNPRPEVGIERLSLRSAGTEAIPMLIAATRR